MISLYVTQFKSSLFKMRFGYTITQAGVPRVGGWNVDDVTLAATACK